MHRTFDRTHPVQVHNPQEISVITRVQSSQYFPVWPPTCRGERICGD